jgi:transcriptional regulator with XRE-family HTH domain
LTVLFGSFFPEFPKNLFVSFYASIVYPSIVYLGTQRFFAMMPSERPIEPVESQGEFPLPRQMTVTTEKGQKSIADRLMKLRKDRGITQIEMAKKLKTSQSIYSRYERGEMRLHAEMLLALSKILSVTPNEILGVTKSGNPVAEPSDDVIPKRFLRALRGIDKLTKTQQDSLLMLIDASVNYGRKKRSTESSPDTK